ncbi:MAG TPA: helix-turn-helix transcriptional regulator [Aquabacterium sp.]|nr:helix-turn-helix transcriptional regulator [Aquabacterium sp.]
MSATEVQCKQSTISTMVDNDPVDFGERLASAMAKHKPKKVEIQELADVCGVSYQAVKKWLGSPNAVLSAAFAMKAAKYLDVNVAWLVLGEGPMAGEVKANAAWCLEDVDEAAYNKLSPTQKGAAMKAMRDEINYLLSMRKADVGNGVGT